MPISTRACNKLNITNPFVVLGNGPSLKDIDFTQLDGFDTCGFNAAYRQFQRINYWPKYFASLDYNLSLSHKDEFAKLVTKEIPNNIQAFFFPSVLIDLRQLGTDNVYIIPTYTSPSCKFYPKGPSLKPSLLNIHWVGNSAATMVEVAMCIGYTQIVLLGVDASYVEHLPETKVADAKKHLMVVNNQIEHNPNYWFDDYQQVGDQYSIPNCVQHHLLGWWMLKDYTDSVGVKVINGAPNSALQEWPKTTWDKALKYFRESDVDITNTECPVPQVQNDISLEAITVCVNYSDYFKHTISKNKQCFNRWVIVTVPKDTDTIHLCEENDLEYIFTKRLYEGGATFAKGRAINDGLEVLNKSDWIVHIDADIILFPDVFQKIIRTFPFDKHTLYGLLGRYGITCVVSLESFMSNKANKYNIVDKNFKNFKAAQFIGYFQMWHSSFCQKYPEEQLDATKDDKRLANLFKSKCILPTYCLHLGTPGINHHGRKSERFKLATKKKSSFKFDSLTYLEFTTFGGCDPGDWAIDRIQFGA